MTKVRSATVKRYTTVLNELKEDLKESGELASTKFTKKYSVSGYFLPAAINLRILVRVGGRGRTRIYAWNSPYSNEAGAELIAQEIYNIKNHIKTSEKDLTLFTNANKAKVYKGAEIKFKSLGEATREVASRISILWGLFESVKYK